jgi:hypothetical protein
LRKPWSDCARSASVTARLDALGVQRSNRCRRLEEAWAADLSENEWRALNERRALQLDRADTFTWRSIPHRIAAGVASDTELLGRSARACAKRASASSH